MGGNKASVDACMLKAGADATLCRHRRSLFMYVGVSVSGLKSRRRWTRCFIRGGRQTDSFWSKSWCIFRGRYVGTVRRIMSNNESISVYMRARNCGMNISRVSME